MSFRGALLELVPKWLDGPVTRAYVGALGDAYDGELAAFQPAIEQRFLALCDEVRLDVVAAGYAIERFDGESLAAFRPRALTAWQTWAEAGTRPSIIDSLHAYGVRDVEIYESKGDR